jgi:hypothetical protein
MTDAADSFDWWQTTTFDELRHSMAVVQRFQERLAARFPANDSADVQTGQDDGPNQVARAILLQRFMSDDTTLEHLLERAEIASEVVNAALRSGQDPRDDSAAVGNHRLLEILQPVLLLCGQMLDTPSQDNVGPVTRSTAEALRRLLFDYSLVPLHFGIRSRWILGRSE